MVKYICDKCKAEVGGEEGLYPITITAAVNDGLKSIVRSDETYRICKTCNELFTSSLIAQQLDFCVAFFGKEEK